MVKGLRGEIYDDGDLDFHQAEIEYWLAQYEEKPRTGEPRTPPRSPEMTQSAQLMPTEEQEEQDGDITGTQQVDGQSTEKEEGRKGNNSKEDVFEGV